jgi:hypothetical protein
MEWMRNARIPDHFIERVSHKFSKERCVFPQLAHFGAHVAAVQLLLAAEGTTFPQRANRLRI